MKKLIIIAALLLMAGCKDGSPQPGTQGRINLQRQTAIVTCIPVVEGIWFEGHRYIVVYSSTGCGITHAENCPCLNNTDQ